MKAHLGAQALLRVDLAEPDPARCLPLTGLLRSHPSAQSVRQEESTLRRTVGVD